MDQSPERRVAIGATWLRTEAVERGQSARGSDHEGRSVVAVGPAGRGRPVEVAIDALHQAARVGPSAVRAGKAVQRGQSTGGGNHENRAAAQSQLTIAAGPAAWRCAVEVSIAALNQSSGRIIAIGAAGLGTKAIQRGQSAGESDIEHRATAVNRTTTLVGTTAARRSIEISVSALDEGRLRICAIRDIETHQRRKSLCMRGTRRQTQRRNHAHFS